MGENIENMINVLETEIDILKDKIEYNNLEGSLTNISNMKDKVERKRILYMLNCLKKSAEHYINKIESEEK